MALSNRFFTWDKYAKVELVFFVCLCFIVPMMSDLEYGLYEDARQLTRQQYGINVTRRMVWGFFSFIEYYLFYKLAIQQLLIRKRYMHFLLSVLLYIVLLSLYMRYIEWPAIAHMDFLPEVLVKEAKKNLASQRWFFFTIHYLFLQILQMAALAYFIDYDKQQKQLHAIKQAQLESEMQQLKMQLQPHFFFNTLNNIYSLAQEQSQLTAPLVARLSELMRYVLYDARRSGQLLKNEVRFLEDYVAIESVRYNNRIRILFDTQGIDETTVIEPLLLLPFVENAFKHGVADETGEGFVECIICLQGKELTLSVNNSIAKKAGNTTHIGIGMENAAKRLALLYPDKHALTVKETGDTYSVFLTIILN